MFKKLLITFILLLTFATPIMAFETPYTERNSETYKFIYRVALDLYLNNTKKKQNDSALICALKAIQLSTVPYSNYSFGINDVEIREMASMIEEDLLKEVIKK